MLNCSLRCRTRADPHVMHTDPASTGVADACQLSPGHLPSIINVAASDSSDTRWEDSNYGKCVDIYAPGVAILSSMYYNPTATLTASGTSMACPHASGAAAQYLQLNPSATPQEVSALAMQRIPTLLLGALIETLLVTGTSPSREW